MKNYGKSISKFCISNQFLVFDLNEKFHSSKSSNARFSSFLKACKY